LFITFHRIYLHLIDKYNHGINDKKLHDQLEKVNRWGPRDFVE